MLIGVSGKIGSGKDTVGKIIQVICLLKETKIPYSVEAVNYNLVHNFAENNKYYGNWEIKKYAYKLKQFVSLLTGCEVKDLESQEFKSNMLPMEWQKVIGQIDGEPLLADDDIKTYRWMLQQVGTEAMRNNIHENVWINALFCDYKNFHTDKFSVRQGITKPEYPNWIITDCRFPNEAKAIEDRSGFLIRVNRDVFVKGDTNNSIRVTRQPFNEHPSETGLDDYNFKHVIDNNGTMDDLIEKVKIILESEEII